MTISTAYIKKLTILIALIFTGVILTNLIDSGIAFIAIEGLLVIFLLFRNNEETFNYFVILTIVQNFILIICARQFNSIDTTIMILVKEMMVYLGAMMFIIKKQLTKISYLSLSFYIFLLICLVNVLQLKFSDNVREFHLSLILASMRQFMIPFLCFYFGMGLTIDRKNINIEKTILIFNFILCVSGLLIYLNNPEKFWFSIGYDKYLSNKLESVSISTIGNFYTYDLGPKLKRFVSIMADPLAFSHFITIGLLILFYEYHKKYRFAKILFVICTVLCLSKFHIVVLIVVLFLAVYTRSKSAVNKTFYRLVFVILGLGMFYLLANYTENLSHNTAIGNHFGSLLYGIENLSLTGQGLGTTGWNSLLAGLDVGDVSQYTESFFATLSSQVGIIGIIPFYLFIGLIIKWLLEIYARHNDKLSYISAIMLFAVVIESLVSASSISMLGSGLYFILAGICCNGRSE